MKYVIVAERLKALRDARGWSQEQVSMKTGISQTYLSDLERVRRTSVSADYAMRLAEAFGVKVDDLMRRT